MLHLELSSNLAPVCIEGVYTHDLTLPVGLLYLMRLACTLIDSASIHRVKTLGHLLTMLLHVINQSPLSDAILDGIAVVLLV